MKLLSWLAPPTSRQRIVRRRRPEGITFNVDDRPPLGTVVGLGAQHALLAAVFSIYAVMFAQGIGLGPADAAALVSGTLFLMGLGTILQAVPSRIGPGLLLVSIPGPGRVGVALAVTLSNGLGALMGATIGSALLTLGFSRIVSRLRSFFPAEVTGVVVLMLGLTLVGGGVSRSLGIGPERNFADWPSVLAAAVTIICLVGLAVWGGPRLRRMALLIGASAGTITVALTTGFPVGALDTLAGLPGFAVPLIGLNLPAPVFHPAAFLPVLVISLIGVMDQIGSVVTVDRMNDADWRRADTSLVGRSITAFGIMQLLNGLTATPTSGTSSANIGLAHASGVTAWRVGVAAGAFMMVAAFLPVLAGLLVLLPTPVLGGIIIYTAAFLVTSGVELISSRMMNTQRSFTVGFSVVAGTSVMVLPQIGRMAPEWAQVLVQSGLTVGSITAIALNGLFRIGVKKTVRRSLLLGGEARDGADMLEELGRSWGVRRDTILRAGHAVGEAVEILRNDGVEGGFTLMASFDEFTLNCIIGYTGQALRLNAEATESVGAGLLDADEDAVEAAMRAISERLVRHLADRTAGMQRGSQAELHLAFEH